MDTLGPGEAYVSTRRHSGVYHTWQCGTASQLQDPDVAIVDDLPSMYQHCAVCERGPGADMGFTSVPETVACPCGRGYAKRRPEPIIEKVNGSWDQRRLTHCYRHSGCPVGGHIVEQAGRIRFAAGPLFSDDVGRLFRMTGIARPELAADGGEPEDTEGVFP